MLQKVKESLRKIIPIEVKQFLLKKRVFLNGSIAEYIGVATLFTLITVVITNFIITSFDSSIFVDSAGDGTAGFLWLNYVDRGLSLILSPTDYVNYPYGETLGSASFITYSTLWVPLRIFSFLFGPIVALNLVTFGGYILSALAGYWLVKKLTGSVWIALFAGYAIAFSPYAVIKSSGHLAYIFSVVFVLIVAGFIGVWKRPTVLRAILFALAIAAAIYTDGYYILLSAVLVGALCLGGLLSGFILRYSLKDFLLRVKFLFLSLGALLVLLIPIGYVQLTQGSDIQGELSSARSNIVNEMNEYRAWPIDFVLPPISNPILDDNEDFVELNEYRNTRSNHSENSNYLGVFVVLFSGIGFVAFAIFIIRSARKKLVLSPKNTNFVLVASIAVVATPLFLAFMLSPSVTVLGTTFYLPGQLLLDHGISYWRVMSRFYIPLHVVVVLFAAVSFALLLNRLTRKKGIYKKIGIVAILLVWVFTGLEYATTANRPSFNINQLPSGYTWLRDQTDINVIVEAPLVDPLDHRTARYVTAQIHHGKKLINTKEPKAGRANNVLGSLNNPEAVDYIIGRGAQAVITHVPKCEVFEWATLVHESPSYEEGERMCIYKIKDGMQSDTAFLVYEDGIWAGPRSEGSSKTNILDDVIDMNITNATLEQRYEGMVDLSMEISCAAPYQWTLTQDATVVSSGVGGQIAAELDGSKPVALTLYIDAPQSALSCTIDRSTVTGADFIR